MGCKKDVLHQQGCGGARHSVHSCVGLQVGVGFCCCMLLHACRVQEGGLHKFLLTNVYFGRVDSRRCKCEVSKTRIPMVTGHYAQNVCIFNTVS